MLAQSPPRTVLTSEADMRKALSMGMDLSPSQLVTHPTQLDPQELQGLLATQSQPYAGFTQTLPLEQQLLLQSLASFSFGNPAPGTNPPAQAHDNMVSLPVSQDAVPFHAVSSDSNIPPLASGNIPGPVLNAINDGSKQRSSSASSDPIAQVAGSSRRSDGFVSRSPKSAPAEAMSFGRLNHAARQRTAQACEKCRDRKTKCSGTRPTCKRCADRGLQCVWASDSRVRGPAKPTRQSRYEAGDNIGEPLAALPVPLSEPSSQTSSPSLRGKDYVHSAPAYQTTFPAIALPSHLIRKDQEKRQSWNEGMIFTGNVAKGLDALSIMGEPIMPLNAADEGWGSVESATLEMQGRDRSTTNRPRERHLSVSVAHLARARNLRDEDQQMLDSQASGFTSFLGDLSTIPHSSPPPFGVSSSEASESEHTLSHPASRNSTSSEPGLHQPRPSYDATSQLSGEMMQLLNFPTVPEYDMINGIPPFADGGFEIPDINKTQNAQPVTSEAEDELFAQYFDTDAFGSQSM